MWPMLLGLLGKAGALFTGINIGALFSSVETAISDLIKNIVANWKVWLIVLLIVGNGGFAWEWHHTSGLLTKEKAAHAADIQNFKNAQALADAKAQAERTSLLKESKANAAQADANYTGLAAKYHASLVRYAQTTSGSKGPGDNQLPTPKGADGPGTSSDLPATLTITGSDAQICADNTARLEAAHDWALALPKEVGEAK